MAQNKHKFNQKRSSSNMYPSDYESVATPVMDKDPFNIAQPSSKYVSTKLQLLKNTDESFEQSKPGINSSRNYM